MAILLQSTLRTLPRTRNALIVSHLVTLNLSRLNPQQREAVLHRQGPLLILAGAGSGKTNTMAHRIAYLIADRGLKPSQILGLSFTNKAATELKERVQKMVASTGKDINLKGLTVSTFHSYCVKLIRIHATRLGFNPQFTILDSGDQNDILKQVLKSIKIDDRKFDTGFLLSQFSKLKNESISTEDAQQHFLESIDTGRLHVDYAVAAASAFPKYQERLRSLNAMDFDDLLYQGQKLLSEHEDIREKVRSQLEHVLVDEYQDTNPAQFRLLELVNKPTNPNLCVVGDDDQSIYAWRGADSMHILQFTHQFPGAKVITLEQNYRSTQIILDAANKVIAENTVRHSKKLWSEVQTGPKITQLISEDDRAEAETVVDDIRSKVFESHHGVLRQIRPFSDYAILYRSNAQSRAFEETLRMAKVPYQMIGGMSYLDRKEIKDLLSYWRSMINPCEDASLRRIIHWPARGIGKKTIESLHEASIKEGYSLFEALEKEVKSSEAQTKIMGALKGLYDLLTGFRIELEALPLDPAAISKWANDTITKIGMEKAIREEEDSSDTAEKKIENIREMANSIALYKAQDFELPTNATSLHFMTEYLARLALQSKDDLKNDKDMNADQVTLMTLHSSKGLEFRNVYLVGVEDGYLPHKRTLEENADLSEERRLCYVGMTRAKHHLTVSRARYRVRYGKKIPRNLSRFLEKIATDHFETRDETAPLDLSSVEAQEKHETRVKSFLDQLKSKLS